MEELCNKDTNELTYVIQNIVVKSSLKREIDLDHISKKLRNAKYNAGTFPGLFIRYNNPKGVIILFKSGKIVITGLLKFIHIPAIVERLILSLSKHTKYEIKENAIATEIVNIVVTANYHKRIDLNLAIIRLRNALYEPEVFPGIVYRRVSPYKQVFLIFSTGKVVLTGIRKKEIIEPALVFLGRLLKEKLVFVEEK